MQTNLTDELMRAEGLMIQDQDEEARMLLERLAEDAEEYVDRNCPVTESVQWFSFPTMFDRLCYRRVEEDPRELHDVGEPLDRLYADLALACVCTNDYDAAKEALKAAVRWNPMNCAYRLDLADLFLIDGDVRECMGLTYSVFERASDVYHLIRAYITFANYFAKTQNPRAGAACLYAARRFGVEDTTLASALDQAAGTEWDPEGLTEDEVSALLAEAGLPEGANAEVAICLLMCATDAAAAGDRNLATELTLRARDLVGEAACMTLVALIREADE